MAMALMVLDTEARCAEIFHFLRKGVCARMVCFLRTCDLESAHDHQAKEIQLICRGRQTQDHPIQGPERKWGDLPVRESPFPARPVRKCPFAKKSES
jgi:hypothetical protein